MLLVCKKSIGLRAPCVSGVLEVLFLPPDFILLTNQSQTCLFRLSTFSISLWGFVECGPAVCTAFSPGCFGCWEAELSSAMGALEEPQWSAMSSRWLGSQHFCGSSPVACPPCCCTSSPQNLAVTYFYSNTMSLLVTGHGAGPLHGGGHYMCKCTSPARAL